MLNYLFLTFLQGVLYHISVTIFGRRVLCNAYYAKLSNNFDPYKVLVTWYATGRRKIRLISPTLCVWTNKSKDWPLKGRYGRKSNYSHSMTCNRLDREGNVGHCSSMTGWNREEEERGQMIGQTLSAKNSTFSSEEIWKGIFSSRTEVGVKRCADL